MKRIPLLFFLILLSPLCFFNACSNPSLASQPGSHTITIVAAENFYGDIVKQIGGSHVSVTSILSDPNVDPHEYQSSVQTGLTVSQADLVIKNGGGYDDWMDKILSAAPKSNRLLLTAYALAPVHLPENEHVWYSFANISAIAQAITTDLQKLDPPNAHIFTTNLQTFQQSLQPLQSKIEQIRMRYNGTPVGLTETIYLYQAQLEGLRVLTPFAFAKAIAEGNDPPADAVITTTDQIVNHQIKVLLYNKQTVTPVTTNLENLARTKHIPLVPLSETMPVDKTYQTWMSDQLSVLQTALGG